MLTITNSARFSRLSPAKMDSNERNRDGFSRRVTNLMTTICTAIYLGIGRRMRRRNPPPKERKTNLGLLTCADRASPTSSCDRKFADGKTQSSIVDRNPRPHSTASHLMIGGKTSNISFFSLIKSTLIFSLLRT